ncbi:hypothetical protein GCM10007276_16410 [Agaricicola taiwanensis]|uniref:NAD-dependent epimerase/dehydratase domain-containing protein n=2 Tax=Agaricicola taiwanensis TaxID=591372 RepID=A0A8J2VWI2_9RHOB|nr:hypothetical protein GCM10007276_16410 [Agaricicola taiwanensis]
MIGRALAERWPAGGCRLRLLFHRTRPQWQRRDHVVSHRVDLQSADDLLRALDDATVVIDLLRPVGDGWRIRAAECLGEVIRRSNVRRVLHASSIDVYGACKTELVDADTPPEPVSDYAREHLAAERLAESRSVPSSVLRLGAVFGPGSKNLASLASETAKAPAWRLAARRSLNGTRRLHLVSLETVTEAILTLIGTADTPPRLVITDDAAPTNNFAYAQDLLIAALQRPSVASTPVLPRSVLHAVLALRGYPPALAHRRFSATGLPEVDSTAIAYFPERLKAYIDALTAHLRSG